VKERNSMKVDDQVLAVLDRAEKEGNTLRLVGQLDRSLYVRANKVLEAAGAKWNKKASAHIFDGDSIDAMEQIILTGEVTAPQDFGFFQSPPSVVARLMALARIEKGMTVREPSAGHGAIVAALHAAGASVDAMDLLPANVAVLKKQGLANTIDTGDFLLTEPRPCYDRVVMNPPFAQHADIRHVMHALRFLKPLGHLVSVMSSGVTFRDNKLSSDFRALLRERGGELEALPEGSFKASGTAVNTVIVTIPASPTRG
jgi:predicted RNA methylase